MNLCYVVEGIYQSTINPQLLLSIQQTLMDQILGLDYFVNEISVWQKNIQGL